MMNERYGIRLLDQAMFAFFCFFLLSHFAGSYSGLCGSYNGVQNRCCVCMAGSCTYGE